MEIRKIQDRGMELFSVGYNCAQATFAALAPSFGVDEATALKTAAMFGGGIARTGGLCGAVTGALMAAGLKLAPAETSGEIKSTLYERGRALMDAFKKEKGSLICRDLIGCDLSTEEGRAAASERNTHANICTKLVRDAIALVADLT
jgi:C_GCAxxG_C_C family probable redox protein